MIDRSKSIREVRLSLVRLFPYTFEEERKYDNAFYKKAEDIYHAILHAIENNPTDEIVDMDPYKVDLIVYFRKMGPKYNALYEPKEKIIIVNANKGSDHISIIKNKKDSIIHEIIHYIDMQRRNFLRIDAKPNISQDDDYKQYVNNPMEFNAMFHAFSVDLRDLVTKILKDNTILDKTAAFEREIGSDANKLMTAFFVYLKSKKKIDDNLSPLYRRKWGKRVYDLYFNLRNDFLERLEPDMMRQIKKDYRENSIRKIKC